jgi:glycosyltransferase involved in cell wall biosynthesis
VLPKALATLVANGDDVVIDIVGPPVGRPGEMEQQAIEQEAARLGVASRLRFRGAIALEALLPLYREYDLFVLPTLPGEGIPRVLLEAMASGLPVVTTNVAGIPSLVTSEVNGLLVEPAAEAVAAAMARVIGDAPLRRGLIARGYETASGFTLEAQAARLMQEVSRSLGLELRAPAPSPAA